MVEAANGSSGRGSARSVLPWLVGAGALLVFLITLSRWISVHNLLPVARIAGWNWQPEPVYPVTTLVFLPFRLLPEAWIPLAANLFTACCAALVLVLLARSVALLRPDGRHHRRRRLASLAWIPAVLAALVCGLQLTFWQQATSVTGDMIDLLIFAYVIRCLLEFRADRDESWLARAAFLYAAGMTNNWGLMVFVPIFLVALVRLQRLEVLNLRFLLRLGLWGLAGLSFYLVLPVLNSLSSGHRMGFWPALKFNLRFQKENLSLFRYNGLLLLALTTFLPLLVISIRWRSKKQEPGDDSQPGRLLTRAIVHFAHAVLLCASLWLMLDPPFSPRSRGAIGAPLAQYYISALVAGYCAGYFLSLASRGLGSHSQGRGARTGSHAHSAGPRTYLAYGIVAAVCLLLVAIPSILVLRNLPQIRASNGPALREFARELYRALPAGKSVALSDDPREIFLLQGELAAHGGEKEAIPLITGALQSSRYQLYMARHFNARWPLAPAPNGAAEIRPMNPSGLLYKFSEHEPLVYLHPSFDYCYELFADEPHAPAHFLTLRATNIADARVLDARIAAANEQYWQECWTNSLQRLAASLDDQTPRWAARVFARLRLKPEQNTTALFSGRWHSRCLDYWGVQMQRLGQWKEAGLWFQRALELNPVNLSAQINLDYNQRHQQGDTARLSDKAVEELSGKYRSRETNMRENGPVDEPSFLWLTAYMLWAEGNYHQAADGYARCADLDPGWLAAKIGLAECYLRVKEFSGALHLAEKVASSSPPAAAIDEAKVVSFRSRALEGLGRKEEAEACIVDLASRHSTDILSNAVVMYLQRRQIEPALTLLNQLLKREPENPEFLSNKGWTEILVGRYGDAIATLTRAVSLAPTNSAIRVNRATAFMDAGQLDAARGDYQELLEHSTNTSQALYGLAEVALRRQDTNAAVGFYQRVLSTSSPQSEEHKLASRLLQGLRSR